MRLINGDALLTWFDEHYDDEIVTVGYVAGLIKDEPTIEPEPKTGKWILDWKHNKATCSECHRSFYDAFDIENYDNFCRVCGVKMESAVRRV